MVGSDAAPGQGPGLDVPDRGQQRDRKATLGGCRERGFGVRVGEGRGHPAYSGAASAAHHGERAGSGRDSHRAAGRPHGQRLGGCGRASDRRNEGGAERCRGRARGVRSEDLRSYSRGGSSYAGFGRLSGRDQGHRSPGEDGEQRGSDTAPALAPRPGRSPCRTLHHSSPVRCSSTTPRTPVHHRQPLPWSSEPAVIPDGMNDSRAAGRRKEMYGIHRMTRSEDSQGALGPGGGRSQSGRRQPLSRPRRWCVSDGSHQRRGPGRDRVTRTPR